MSDPVVEKIQRHPKYHELRSTRTPLGIVVGDRSHEVSDGSGIALRLQQAVSADDGVRRTEQAGRIDNRVLRHGETHDVDATSCFR